MSNWLFTPFAPSAPNDPGLPPPEQPDNKDSDAKCPWTDSTPSTCDPFKSGTATLHLDLSSVSGCQLFPPIGISFLQVDENLDDGILLHHFSGADGGVYSFPADPGTYLFDISGSLGSRIQLPVSVTQEGIVVSGLGISMSGAKSCNSISRTTVSWSGGYSYSVQGLDLNGFSRTGFSADLPVGDYQVDISRGACSTQITLSVNEDHPLGVTVNSISLVSCTGKAFDGVLRASGFGGNAPYKFTWLTGNVPFATGATQSGLNVGSYQVIVTDASGCSAYGEGSIGYNNRSLNVTTQFTSRAKNVICCQESANTFASLCAMVGGGVPPFKYQWSNGSTGVCATGLSQGDYSVMVTDSVGCVAFSAPQNISIANDCYMVKWDFGNGNTQEYMATPDALFNSVQNPYAATGTYRVKFMAVNGVGQSGIICKNVTVPNCPRLSGIGIFDPSGFCLATSPSMQTFSGHTFASDGAPVGGIVMHVYRHSLNTSLPPYDNPLITPICGRDGFNVVQETGSMVVSDVNGNFSFSRSVSNCEGISVRALAVDNSVGKVDHDVVSNIWQFNDCGGGSPTDPSGGGNPPVPPVPPFPPLPPGPTPDPTDPDNPDDPNHPPTDVCPCCVPQGNFSSACQMMSRKDCIGSGGSVATLNGLSSGACYGSCEAVPNKTTDCNGKVWCQEGLIICCTKDGCVSRTPCECQNYQGGGTAYPVTKDLASANAECVKDCTTRCCDGQGQCKTVNGNGASAAASCANAGGRPTSDCKECKSCEGMGEDGCQCSAREALGLPCCCGNDYAPNGPGGACIPDPC